MQIFFTIVAASLITTSNACDPSIPIQQAMFTSMPTLLWSVSIFLQKKQNKCKIAYLFRLPFVSHPLHGHTSLFYAYKLDCFKYTNTNTYTYTNI